MEITKEEIEKEAWNSEHRQIGDCGPVYGFIEGAEWVLDKIKLTPDPTEDQIFSLADTSEQVTCSIEMEFKDIFYNGFKHGIEWYKNQIGLP